MKPFDMSPDLAEAIRLFLHERGCRLTTDETATMVDMVREEVLFQYVDRLIHQIDVLLEISPNLSEREILEAVARQLVAYFGAKAATVRIYDPGKGELISFGGYPDLAKREEAIPMEDTIAGEVIRTHRSHFVPNIDREPRYKDKEKIKEQGIYSVFAVPISIPRFSITDVDTEGVLQIYFEERDRVFTPLEAKIAEVFSRRVSYVVARKRILDLEKMNVTRDRIVEKIFQKLGRREGIKMKEIFNLVIPELLDIMRIRRCSLFSVMEDRQHVMLEAGYPEMTHGIGKIFSVKEPYIDAVINQTGPFGEFEHEKIYPTYILISNPQESRLIPSDLKRFLQTQEIHSILYIPLKVKEGVNYFLAFDAQAHHKRFTDQDIEIFTFFGMELMKGLRLEKMDDILHDFKNPAIAVAGFAKRLHRMLREGEYLSKKEKIDQALEIILKETSRIQELALTLHGEGREQVINFTEKLTTRFQLNAEAIRELGRSNIQLKEGPHEGSLWIRCFPLHIERVLDNLLNNASNAIPEKGGVLSIRSYPRDGWGVAEITNTGEIPEEERDRTLHGDSRGRGLHITTRLVKQMGGQMEVKCEQGQTTFRIMFPLIQAPPAKGE